jgi:hypothetical protein
MSLAKPFHQAKSPIQATKAIDDAKHMCMYVGATVAQKKNCKKQMSQRRSFDDFLGFFLLCPDRYVRQDR